MSNKVYKVKDFSGVCPDCKKEHIYQTYVLWPQGKNLSEIGEDGIYTYVRMSLCSCGNILLRNGEEVIDVR